MSTLQEKQPLPTPQALADAWAAWKRIVGVSTIQTEEDYARVTALLNLVLDETRGQEQHPLAEVLDYLSHLMEEWEEEHVKIPASTPASMLAFLMEQNGLSQSDLVDCASQARISEILSGKRPPSKEIAKKLAQRFHVPADLFL
jgi:HTH-type transcriptional regulator/antitoxin HigA